MKLGRLIDSLEQLDPDMRVRYAGHETVGFLHSYRGFYDQLALDFGGDPGSDYRTVGELLKALKDADGATFTGYKGGEYAMDRDTTVWAGNYGESSDCGIAGVEVDGPHAVIKTVDVGDYIFP